MRLRDSRSNYETSDGQFSIINHCILTTMFNILLKAYLGLNYNFSSKTMYLGQKGLVYNVTLLKQVF